MKNVIAIKDISGQISGIAETIEDLVDGIERTRKSPYEVGSVYEEMVLDEITHMQVLVLELTKAATGAVAEVPEEDAQIREEAEGGEPEADENNG